MGFVMSRDSCVFKLDGSGVDEFELSFTGLGVLVQRL